MRILAGGLLAGILVWSAVVYVPGAVRYLRSVFSRTSGSEEAVDQPVQPEIVVVSPKGNPPPPPPEELDKKQLAEIIGPHPFKPDEIHSFRIVDEGGNALHVQTTLDPDLQSWALNILSRSKARSAALVAMDPRSGDVLTMASYQADGQAVNLALTSSFPAASLFKIVTAAAAVEKENMDGGTTLAYDGRKYTLYKKDLTGDVSQGRNKVTLNEGFAKSINTVFGKLGAFTLGQKELETFARKFHFNRKITFEMPVEQSQFQAPTEEDPYRLAELASGFNRTTTVSPLHGAMLASAIINQGTLMEPSVVREVFDLDNRIFYKHDSKSLGRVVSDRTAREMHDMMLATISKGTGRRRFLDARRHPVLSQLEIGGKSGTINNNQGHKVDWFVCFAKNRHNGEALALASVVIHFEKLGTRSQEIVREAIIRYFRSRVGKAGG